MPLNYKLRKCTFGYKLNRLQNLDKIRTRSENETYKYLGILEVNTIKQMEMKNKNISGELENYSRQNSQAETLSKE